MISTKKFDIPMAMSEDGPGAEAARMAAFNGCAEPYKRPKSCGMPTGSFQEIKSNSCRSWSFGNDSFAPKCSHYDEADRRNAAAGRPKVRRNVLLKCAESAKPALCAASVSEVPPAYSATARSSRSHST